MPRLPGRRQTPADIAAARHEVKHMPAIQRIALAAADWKAPAEEVKELWRLTDETIPRRYATVCKKALREAMIPVRQAELEAVGLPEIARRAAVGKAELEALMEMMKTWLEP